MSRVKKVLKFCVHSRNGYNSSPMGKGDKKTKRGKIFRGSHGKTRPRKKEKSKRKPSK